jgi:glycyl-tRNA synthetase beta chain
MPVGEGAELPGSVFSSILSLSIKLDTLMGLFSVGMIPSGSKEPFALTRAQNGIVRIVVAHDLPFDIETVTNLLKDQYEPFDLKRLEEFIIERIYKAFDANTSVITAVLASGERDINEIYKKVKALDSIVSGENSRELFTTFKRVANISGDVDPDSDLNVNPALFEDPREGELYDRFREVVSTEYEDYEERLRALFGLKKPLDDFFDNVLVNTDDPDRRKNRRDLIASIYRAFKSIADIKEISV